MAKTKKIAKAATDMPSAQPEDRDWEGEGHARTLMEAHEIMADPDKMKKAQKHLKKKAAAIKSVKDLVNFKNQKYGAQGSGGMSDADADGM